MLAVRAKSILAAGRKEQEALTTEMRMTVALEIERQLAAKERAREEKLAALRPIDHRPAFTTLRQRTAVEDARPVQAPSGARVDDLKEPWQPSSNIFATAAEDRSLVPMRYHGAKGMIDTNPGSVFAERAVDKLQREQAEKEEALARWKAKVVVDDLAFHTCNRQGSEKPHLIDKYRSMLMDTPRKKSVKMNFVPPPPVSIREVEKEIPNEHVSPKETKHPEARRFYYAKQVGEKIPRLAPMSAGEKHGALWGSH